MSNLLEHLEKHKEEISTTTLKQLIYQIPRKLEDESFQAIIQTALNPVTEEQILRKVKEYQQCWEVIYRTHPDEDWKTLLPEDQISDVVTDTCQEPDQAPSYTFAEANALAEKGKSQNPKMETLVYNDYFKQHDNSR